MTSRTILVPQGAEYQAVCRGLKSVATPPLVVPIPVGVAPVTRFLQQWQRSPIDTDVLVMGLCGSLTSKLRVGDLVLYDECIDRSGAAWRCITQPFQATLNGNATCVRALTSDRILASAAEKRRLGIAHQADVVDMEGIAILKSLAQSNISITMLRVVSDDIRHDLPDLTNAISPEGRLRSLPLAWGMIRQPIAATRLIQGSLQGLRVLRQVTELLLSPHQPQINNRYP